MTQVLAFDIATGQMAPMEFTPAQIDPAEALAAWRASASLSRGEFVVRCLAMGVFGQGAEAEAQAELAASGQWPDVFSNFIAPLPVAQRIAARTTWADASTVRRANPFIAAIAAHLQITDAQVDTLFGWQG